MNSVAPSRRESARSRPATSGGTVKWWLAARASCRTVRGWSTGISSSGGAPARRSFQ